MPISLEKALSIAQAFSHEISDAFPGKILAVFAIAYFSTQYVSLGSVLAAAAFALSFVILHFNRPVVMLCGVFTGALAIWMHRPNVIRLLNGQERKTNLFKKDKA